MTKKNMWNIRHHPVLQQIQQKILLGENDNYCNSYYLASLKVEEQEVELEVFDPHVETGVCSALGFGADQVQGVPYEQETLANQLVQNKNDFWESWLLDGDNNQLFLVVYFGLFWIGDDDLFCGDHDGYDVKDVDDEDKHQCSGAKWPPRSIERPRWRR